MLKLKNKDFDIYLTKLANKLSEINRYNTFPNPSVGAVILKKNDEIKFFFKKIDPILKEYLKQNSITLLIDKKNVIVGVESLDITNNIKNLIDEKIK